jgi:hypothetical protein
MKYLRYYSEFRSIRGVTWRIEILQEAAGAFVPEAIRLSGESPLTIEWNEVDKIEPIQASKATLTLASDSDRKFIDMYSVEAGTIRLDIFREGALYWSGTLDTELYEEPYSYSDNYDVQITFGDFAILERLKWDLRGFHTIGEVFNHLLEKTQRNNTDSLDFVSTKTESGMSIFDRVQINADNFYDEDDIADSCCDVLEAIMQPLAMRMVQRLGEVYFYDLNYIYSETPVPVAWDGDDAVLAADRVYSGITVKLDPNFKGTLVSAQIKNLKITNAYDYFMNYKPITGRREEHHTMYDGFTFGHGSEADSDYIVYAPARYFKIEPKLSGENESGIVFSFCHLPYEKNAQYTRYLSQINMYSPYTDNYAWGGYIFELKKRPVIISHPQNSNYIKIKLDLAFDARYNPYEPKEPYNETTNYNEYDKIRTFYLPVVIELLDDNDSVLYHYKNANIYWNSFGVMNPSSPFGFGDWVQGAHPVINGVSEQGVRDTVHSYLCFYKSMTGNEGGASVLWTGNKPMRGDMSDAEASYMPTVFRKFNDGEYIKFPPVSGRLRIRVVRGFELLTPIPRFYTKIWYMLALQTINRWMLFKDLSVSVVDRYGNDMGDDEDENGDSDNEVREVINAAAKEECSIDTRVGTLASVKAAALGQFFDLQRNIIMKFKRGGEADRLEKLLINTVKANYGSRKNILSGTVELITEFCILSEKNTAGKFLPVSDVQHPIKDTSEIKMIEFVKDHPPVCSVTYDDYMCQINLIPPGASHTYAINYDLYACQTN